MNKYNITVKNISLNGFDSDAVLATASVTTSNIYRALERKNFKELLSKNGIEVTECFGTIMDFYDIDAHSGYAVLGHDGSDCGNIKIINQLEIEWTLAA